MTRQRNPQIITEHVRPARRRDVALNVLGPLLLVALLVFLPYPRYLRYREMGGDAGKIRWVYERIHDRDRPLDIALVGSSRTMVAVDDSLLQAGLADGRGGGPAVANLAVAWEGRNLHYVLTKELLANRRCRMLLLEVDENEERFGHPYFRDLADTRDVIAAPILPNPDYLRDLMHVVPRNLRLLRLEAQARFSDRADADRPPAAAPYFPVVRSGDHSAGEMADLKRRRDTATAPPVLPSALTGLEYRVPRSYVRDIADLARKHGVRLVLVHVPSYEADAGVADPEFYRDLGPVLEPPAELVDDPANWSDASHLNGRGRQVFTRWLAGALADLAETSSS